LAISDNLAVVARELSLTRLLLLAKTVFSTALVLFFFSQELLLEKKNKLMEQHDEAKLLKENIDRRQKAVSETLAGYLNQAQVNTVIFFVHCT